MALFRIIENVERDNIVNIKKWIPNFSLRKMIGNIIMAGRIESNTIVDKELLPKNKLTELSINTNVMYRISSRFSRRITLLLLR